MSSMNDEKEKKVPIPSHEQEDIEEALGVIWRRRELGVKEKSAILPEINSGVSSSAYGVLLQGDYVREENNDIALTPRGETLAKDITRRQRLAERLLTDVLSLDHSSVESNACQLEHILSPEVSASICTLLGHPKECPHGSSIPMGDCCTRAENRVESIVVPLDKMSAGDEGKVAYLALHNHPELHKLLSLGVVPGTQLRLHQTYPTFVLELGDIQLALEETVAKNIYVRRG
jgi:DtxR family transcriptional regulator, Mn-dependent transcriptional regulator